MKNISLITLGLLLANLSLAQELKKVHKQLDPITTEEFYVFKKDKKVKHGLYRKITEGTGHQIVEEGNYKMGKKDSVWKRMQDGIIHKIGTYKDDQKHGTWITYGGITTDTQFVRDSGTYEMGKKIQIWKYYDKDSKPDLIYDYDKQEILFQKQDSLTHLIIIGKDTLAATLDRSPIYLDGWDEFYYTIAHNMHFTTGLYAKTINFKTKIYISFLINERGIMEDVKAISRTNKELNQVMISAIESTNKSNWLPGIYQGRAVKTQIIIPYDFTNKGIIKK